MKIKYKVTKKSISMIENLTFLKSVYKLPNLGSTDEREITRLLENSHYPNSHQILEKINLYGEHCGEILEKLVTCNDTLSFLRYLAEFWLFIYLFNLHKSKVSPIQSNNYQNNADIKIQLDDLELFLEIYTPMDYYGYQVFSRLLTSKLKYLDSVKGFKIEINSVAKHQYYTHDFPEFREVYNWLDDFEKEFISLLDSLQSGDSITIESPVKSLSLKIEFNEINNSPKNRFIIWGQATYSSDTRLYFEIDEPKKFAETDLGFKIKDKLAKQQAGSSNPKKIRIFILNLSMTDTTDISFLNKAKYYSRFEKDIEFLSAGIKPYPPYDLVIPCELGPDNGFIKPVSLSSFDGDLILNIIKKSGLDKPIKEIPVASKEETELLWKAILESNQG